MKKLFFILVCVTTFAQAQVTTLDLPYPVKMVNPVPLNFYYFKQPANTPYASTSEVLSLVPMSVRTGGLLFRVGNVDYQLDNDLVTLHQVGTLGNGNATTANGSAVDLGGKTATATTLISNRSNVPLWQFDEDANFLFGQTPYTITGAVPGSGLPNDNLALCEGCTIHAAPTGGGTVTDAAFFGNQNIIGDNVNTFSGTNTLTYGQENHQYGVSGLVGGRGAELKHSGEPSGSIATFGGIAIGLSQPTTNVSKPVTAYANAINISSNTNAQTTGHGANASLSAIVGGQNHNIPAGATGAGVFGGRGIKMLASDSNTVAFPKVKMFQGTNAAGTVDNSITNILGLDANGNVKLKTGLNPAGTGGTFQFNDGAGSFAATETSTGATYAGRLTYDNILGFTQDTKNTGTNNTSFYSLSAPGQLKLRNGIAPVINSLFLQPTGMTTDVSDGTTKFQQIFSAGTTIEVGGGGNGTVTNTYTNAGMSFVRNTTTSPTTFTFKAADGISGSTPGQLLVLQAGSGFGTGNTNGGDVSIVPGAGHGLGSAGNVNIGSLGVNGSQIIVTNTSGVNVTTSGGGNINLQAGGNVNIAGGATNFNVTSSGVQYTSSSGSDFAIGDGFDNPNNFDVQANTAIGFNAPSVVVNGNAISTAVSTTATLDFPNTTTGISDLTVSLTGAVVGKGCRVGVPNGSITTTATFWCWVSSTNQVTVRFSPKATGGEDPASGSFIVYVDK